MMRDGIMILGMSLDLEVQMAFSDICVQTQGRNSPQRCQGIWWWQGCECVRGGKCRGLARNMLGLRSSPYSCQW